MTVQGIDHIIIAVRSVGDALDLFSGSGFTMTPVGEHLKFKSKNTLAMLDDAYLEIAAPTARESFGEALTNHLDKDGEGFFGVVFGHHNAKAFAELMDLSYTEAEREVDTELLRGVATFRVAWLPDGTIQNTFCFVVEHATPELVWHPELQVHENGANTVQTLYLRSASPRDAAVTLRRQLNLPKSDSPIVAMHQNTITFLSPDEMAIKWGDSARAAIDFSGRENLEKKSLFNGQLILNFIST